MIWNLVNSEFSRNDLVIRFIKLYFAGFFFFFPFLFGKFPRFKIKRKRSQMSFRASREKVSQIFCPRPTFAYLTHNFMQTFYKRYICCFGSLPRNFSPIFFSPVPRLLTLSSLLRLITTFLFKTSKLNEIISIAFQRDNSLILP